MEWIEIAKYGHPEPGFYIARDDEENVYFARTTCPDSWYNLERIYYDQSCEISPTHYMRKPAWFATENLPESNELVEDDGKVIEPVWQTICMTRKEAEKIYPTKQYIDEEIANWKWVNEGLDNARKPEEIL